MVAKKIKIHDNIHGKVVEREIKGRDLDHLQAQIQHKSKVFRNKKKYTRKTKYKERY